MKIIKLIIALTIMVTSQVWGANQQKLLGSGFITDSPAMTPMPEMTGVWYWNEPGVKFQNYNKILLDNIEIFIAPDSKYKGINADQMKVLSDSMRAVMIHAMEPDYPIVTRPGPGVLVARIAITNVYLGKPKHRIGQYTPIGLVFGGIKKLAGVPKNFSIKNASVESELFDGQTGKRVAVRIDTRPLRSLDEGSEIEEDLEDFEDPLDDPKELSWDSIEESLQVYGKRFRERVEQARTGGK
ncbi:MAG: DUF3313 family protein [Gammaproteobacteria bacterium]|nr:DUF3313 family protein [Gammaproteobacteria bacterium]